MTIILLVVTDEIKTERLNSHGNDTMGIQHKGIFEHTETRPLDGIQTIRLPGSILSTTHNCGLQKIYCDQ